MSRDTKHTAIPSFSTGDSGTRIAPSDGADPDRALAGAFPTPYPAGGGRALEKERVAILLGVHNEVQPEDRADPG